MHKVIFTSLLLLLIQAAQCQSATVGLLTGFKDGYGNEFTYTGEIKNGKPSGKGLAIYKTNSKQKYFGDFLNGTFNGKGTLVYSDGRIASGNWKEGKCFGNLVFVSSTQDIYWGNYGKDFFDGITYKVETANGIVIGNYNGTKLNGRVVYVGPSAKNINDNIYVDGDKTGPGYQFDLDQKKLYEGVWLKDVWQSASSSNYPSFMRSKNFLGESNDKRVIFRTNFSAEKNLLEDTCYIYFKPENERMFGNFHLGKMTNGIKTYGDTGRTIGGFDDKGIQGPGMDFCKNRYLSLGTFKDNVMEGEGLYTDKRSDYLYNGTFTGGKFTGKAATVNAYNEITIGTFYQGKKNGLSRIIQANGSSVLADYSMGNLLSTKEVILKGGEKINPLPTSVNTAINDLVKSWMKDFEGIESFDVNNGLEEEMEFEYEIYDTWYTFPGAKYSVVLENDGKSFYMENETYKNFSDLKKAYDKLCKDVAGVNITTLEKGKSFKVKGTINPLITGFTGEEVTEFTIDGFTGAKPYIKVKAIHEGSDFKLALQLLSQE